jgi:ABC-type transport system involved in cytochrome c biogenesis permease subunit
MAVFFYGVCMLHSVFLWRKGFRRHDGAVTGLVLTAFVFHTRALLLRGMSLSHCPVSNLYEATVFVLWTIAAACLVACVFPKSRFLAAFAAPVLFVMGVFALMPSLDIPFKDKPGAEATFRSLHASMILLSYGAFGLSAASGWMFLKQEHDLKYRKPRAFFALLPPIERLDKAMTRLAIAGVVFLTLGLAVAPFLLHERSMHAKASHDPKVIWSMGVWGAYLVLLVWHLRRGLTGRRFAWGAILVFAFVMLTFWGVNLLSPSHNIQ